MCTQKMRALSYIGADRITFPPKPDRQTYRRTDISVYRLAELLIKIANSNSCLENSEKSRGKIVSFKHTLPYL